MPNKMINRIKSIKHTPNKYLIALEETRSKVALAASVIVFFCTLSAVFVLVERHANTNDSALHYFTVLSNLLSATGAAFMIPYAVEGIRKKP